MFKRKRRRKVFRRRRVYRKRKTFRRMKGPEVKYIDISSNGAPISVDVTADGYLRTVNQIVYDPFSRIIPGVGPNQRIGKSIFIKFMVWKIEHWACGFIVNSINRNVNAYLLRLIVASGFVGNSPSNQKNFFSGGTGAKTLEPVNRRYYNCLYDKVFTCNGGYPNYSTTASTDYFAGSIHHTRIKIPVNRTITYEIYDGATDNSSVVKNETDRLTLAVMPTIPNMGGGAANQNVVCTNHYVRIYYTDA